MTGIFNARILASIAMLVFVGAAIASSTGAFFSDTETSTGNTFTAGDIDLQIDNTSYVTNSDGVLVASPENTWAISDLTDQLFFSFEDVKPGDIGEDTISIHAGSNDAWACMALDITATPENSLTEPEGDAGDLGPADGDNGELQDFLEFAWWTDDGDNVFEVGEEIGWTGLAGTLFDGTWKTLADSVGGFFGDEPIPGDSTVYVGKAWCFGELTQTPVAQDGVNTSNPLIRGTGFTCNGAGENNIAQTDGIVVDVDFYAVQSRNNDQFLCSSLDEDPEPVVTRLTLEKTINQDGTNPVDESLWTLTASSTNTTTLISGVESSPAVSSAEVQPGAYVLSENVVAGFTQTGLVCGGNATPLAGNVLTIAAGEQVVCTFTNTENN